eukprot:scaffold32299_cov171-Skeletonema_menzelii.AAC.7
MTRNFNAITSCEDERCVDAGVREQQADAREDKESPEAEVEEQRRGVVYYHFEEKVSCKKYSLVVDDIMGTTNSS